MSDPIVEDALSAKAFERNRLLATFDEKLRDRLTADAEIVTFKVGEEVLVAGQPVERTLFPLRFTDDLADR